MEIKKISFRSTVMAAIFVSAGMLISCTTGSSLQNLSPEPSLSPGEVVGIQLAAFKENGVDDKGIALAYRFASPRNKKITGNVENFASMIRKDPYAPMLYNTQYELGPVDQRGELAMVAVRVDQNDGTSHAYLFVLTKQKGGEYNNCWLTDGVLQIDIGKGRSQALPVTVDI